MSETRTPDAISENIPGWFDFQDFYREAVDTVPPGSTLVEVGVFLGKSLSFLAAAARGVDRGLTVVGVDTFRGSPEILESRSNLAELPLYSLARECLCHLELAGVLADVTLVVADSVRAARLFRDQSLHLVFLDAAHDEASVRADIAAWLPKVAPGGWLAGHDFNWASVRAAVTETLPVVLAKGNTWAVRVEGGAA